MLLHRFPLHPVDQFFWNVAKALFSQRYPKTRHLSLTLSFQNRFVTTSIGELRAERGYEGIRTKYGFGREVERAVGRIDGLGRMLKNKAVYTALVVPSRLKSKSITKALPTDRPTDQRTRALTESLRSDWKYRRLPGTVIIGCAGRYKSVEFYHEFPGNGFFFTERDRRFII